MFRAVIDYVLCQGRTETGDVGEQVLAGGVEVHAHGVHAPLHGEVKGMLQFCLVNIVLVLPHTDGFGIYLYEFRQRVGKASSYAHGTAHGDIVVGELLACYFRSGVY